MMIECKECGIDFDPDSKAKRKTGGLRVHCPDCSEETTVPYLGTSSGEGKQASVQLHKFESLQDREAYQRYFKQVSGVNTGKQCQLGFFAHEPQVKRTVVATFEGNTNHKGKA